MQSWIDELDRLEAEEVSKSIVIKHLPGQHDQANHARGRATPDDAALRARRAQLTGEPMGMTMAVWGGLGPSNMQDFGMDKTGLVINGDAMRRRVWKEEEQQKKFDSMSPIERASMKEAMEDIRRDGTVMIAADAVSARAIVADGEFKSQFETSTSNGAVNQGARAMEETASLDLHPQVVQTKRPIYGHVVLDNKTPGSVAQYGPVRFELKDEVKSRTTMSDGDSLGSRATPIPMKGPITELQAVGASMGFGAYITDYAVAGTAADRMRAVRDVPGAFIEAQIKQGVSLTDVRRVHIPSVADARFDALREDLLAKGIEVVEYG